MKEVLKSPNTPYERIDKAIIKEKELSRKLQVMRKVLSVDLEIIGKIEKIVQYIEKHPSWDHAAAARSSIRSFGDQEMWNRRGRIENNFDEYVKEIEELEKEK